MVHAWMAEMCMDLPVFQIGCTVHERHDSQAAANTDDMHTHMACRLRWRTFGIIKRLRISGFEVVAGPGCVRSIAAGLEQRWRRMGVTNTSSLCLIAFTIARIRFASPGLPSCHPSRERRRSRKGREGKGGRGGITKKAREREITEARN